MSRHEFTLVLFMTGTPASASVSALAACLGLWGVLMALSVQAQDAGLGTAAPAQAVHFDIPAQPLAQALQAFGRMAELVIIAPIPLLQGRMSAPVSGDYPSHEALLRVLAGTGLQADFARTDEVIIVALPASAQAPPTAASIPAAQPPIDGTSADIDYRYAAMVQARLTEVLCASPQTRPGSYRLVAQLHIDDTGAVVDSHVVTSTGSHARDVAIERAIHALVFDSGPPADLAEPVTILLEPVHEGAHIDCPQPDERG